jgi:hypothetical protein
MLHPVPVEGDGKLGARQASHEIVAGIDGSFQTAEE